MNFRDPYLGLAAGYFANRGGGRSPLQALGGGLLAAVQGQREAKLAEQREKQFDLQVKKVEGELKRQQKLEKMAEQIAERTRKRGHGEEAAMFAYETTLSGDIGTGLNVSQRGMMGQGLTGDAANYFAMVENPTYEGFLGYKKDVARAGASPVNVYNEKLPVGWTRDEAGKAVPIPGLEGKAYTQDQRVSAGYASRMYMAEKNLSDILSRFPEFDPSAAVDHYLRGVPLAGAYLQSEPYKLFEQAAKEWARAKLRKESGAAIPPGEWIGEFETYFPQPHDPRSLANQKRLSRESAFQSLVQQAGGAYKQPEWKPYEPTTVKAAAEEDEQVRYFDPATGTFSDTPP